jgi:hypothetical protein
MDVAYNFNPKFQKNYKTNPKLFQLQYYMNIPSPSLKVFLIMHGNTLQTSMNYILTNWKKNVNSPFLFSNIFSNTCILNCATSSSPCILNFFSFIARFIWITNSKLYIYQFFNSYTTLASTWTLHFSSQAISSLVLTPQTFICAFKWVLSLCLRTLLILVHGAS